MGQTTIKYLIVDRLPLGSKPRQLCQTGLATGYKLLLAFPKQRCSPLRIPMLTPGLCRAHVLDFPEAETYLGLLNI